MTSIRDTIAAKILANIRDPKNANDTAYITAADLRSLLQDLNQNVGFKCLAFDSANAYDAGQLVLSSGSIYLALKDVSSGSTLPSTSTNDWQIFASLEDVKAEVNTSVTTIENTVTGLSTTVGTLSRQVSNFNTEVTTLTTKVNGFDATITAQNTKIAEAKDAADKATAATIVNKTLIDGVGIKITALEDAKDDLEAKDSAIDAEIAKLKQADTALAAKITDLETLTSGLDLTDIASDITKLQSDLKTTSDGLATVQTLANANKTKADKANTDLAALKARVKTLEDNYTALNTTVGTKADKTTVTALDTKVTAVKSTADSASAEANKNKAKGTENAAAITALTTKIADLGYSDAEVTGYRSDPAKYATLANIIAVLNAIKFVQTSPRSPYYTAISGTGGLIESLTAFVQSLTDGEINAEGITVNRFHDYLTHAFASSVAYTSSAGDIKALKAAFTANFSDGIFFTLSNETTSGAKIRATYIKNGDKDPTGATTLYFTHISGDSDMAIDKILFVDGSNVQTEYLAGTLTKLGTTDFNRSVGGLLPPLAGKENKVEMSLYRCTLLNSSDNSVAAIPAGQMLRSFRLTFTPAAVDTLANALVFIEAQLIGAFQDVYSKSESDKLFLTKSAGLNPSNFANNSIPEAKLAAAFLTKVTKVISDLAALAPKVSVLEAEMDIVETNISTLDSELDAAETKITALREDLTEDALALTTVKNNLDDLTASVNAEKTKIATNTANYTTLLASVTALQTEVQSLDPNTANNRFTQLQDEIDTLDTKISNLTVSVDSHNDSINTLTSQYTAFNETLDSLSETVDAHDVSITNLDNRTGGLEAQRGMQSIFRGRSQLYIPVIYNDPIKRIPANQQGDPYFGTLPKKASVVLRATLPMVRRYESESGIRMPTLQTRTAFSTSMMVVLRFAEGFTVIVRWTIGRKVTFFGPFLGSKVTSSQTQTGAALSAETFSTGSTALASWNYPSFSTIETLSISDENRSTPPASLDVDVRGLRVTQRHPNVDSAVFLVVSIGGDGLKISDDVCDVEVFDMFSSSYQDGNSGSAHEVPEVYRPSLSLFSRHEQEGVAAYAPYATISQFNPSSTNANNTEKYSEMVSNLYRLQAYMENEEVLTTSGVSKTPEFLVSRALRNSYIFLAYTESLVNSGNGIESALGTKEIAHMAGWLPWNNNSTYSYFYDVEKVYDTTQLNKYRQIRTERYEGQLNPLNNNQLNTIVIASTGNPASYQLSQVPTSCLGGSVAYSMLQIDAAVVGADRYGTTLIEVHEDSRVTPLDYDILLRFATRLGVSFEVALHLYSDEDSEVADVILHGAWSIRTYGWEPNAIATVGLYTDPKTFNLRDGGNALTRQSFDFAYGNNNVQPIKISRFYLLIGLHGAGDADIFNRSIHTRRGIGRELFHIEELGATAAEVILGGVPVSRDGTGNALGSATATHKKAPYATTDSQNVVRH